MYKGMPAKKSLGQHWLFDKDSLESICQAAKIDRSDTVLEVGPGLGSLTELLVSQANQVVAVELDDKLVSELKHSLIKPNLVIVNESILDFDLASLKPGYKLVANIPYYLTSNLIRKISESTNPPVLAVILVQKEVAKRLAAKPGDMSLLSVTAQFYWSVSLGQVVTAELFSPPPKVDSQVVTLSRRSTPLFKDLDSVQYFHLVRAGFAQRRKTLLNALKAGTQLSLDQIMQACDQAGIDPKRRAQTLSLEDWHNLYRAILDLLSKAGLNFI